MSIPKFNGLNGPRVIPVPVEIKSSRRPREKQIKAPEGDYSVLGLNYFPLAHGLFSCDRSFWLQQGAVVVTTPPEKEVLVSSERYAKLVMRAACQAWDPFLP